MEYTPTVIGQLRAQEDLDHCDRLRNPNYVNLIVSMSVPDPTDPRASDIGLLLEHRTRANS
jgi:hypothetical protein